MTKLLPLLLLALIFTLPSRSFSFENTSGMEDVGSKSAYPDGGQPLSAADSSEMIVTAYTLSEDETDNTPCEGAFGDDLCVMSKKLQICATNDYTHNQKLSVGGVECVVLDKMNPRYKNAVDLLFPDKKSALEFGRKKLPIAVLN